MLSYQHGFHAGNFADVHKHTALCLLLRELSRKPQPFFFLDTHGGRGRYDLDGPQARKTGEWQSGIGKLWGLKPKDDALARYIAAVRMVNGGGALRTYPGSPLIAARLARASDEIVAAELHPAELTALVRTMRGINNVRIERLDGFELLMSLVPPKAGRGLVLVDPSYELKDDYAKVPLVIARALARWPAGIFMAWYPILPEGRHASLREGFARIAAGGAPVLGAELQGPPPARGMSGTGFVIVNPPAGFAKAMVAAGDEMASLLFGAAVRHECAPVAGAS